MRSTEFFDGEKAAGASYSEPDYSKITQVVIQPSFGMEGSLGRTSRPEPLPFFYVTGKPLHEALRSPQVVELGPSTVLKRDCVRFKFPKVRWGAASAPSRDTTYHLDKQTAIPLKVVVGDDPEGPLIVWEALSLDETAGGRHLPLHSRETIYNPNGSVKSQYEHTIQEVKYDQTYDKSIFWPKIDETMYVIDRIHKTKKFPSVQTDSHPAAAKQTPETIAAVPAPLIQAAPPASWGGAVVLILGCALIAAAIFLRLRRSAA